MWKSLKPSSANLRFWQVGLLVVLFVLWHVMTKPGLTERTFNYYNDPVWDNVRMNNIFDHFATAYFGVYLKGETDKQPYLDVSREGKDGTWKGFKRNTAVGLTLEHRVAGQ